MGLHRSGVLLRPEQAITDLLSRPDVASQTVGERWQYVFVFILGLGVAWMTLADHAAGAARSRSSRFCSSSWRALPGFVRFITFSFSLSRPSLERPSVFCSRSDFWNWLALLSDVAIASRLPLLIRFRAGCGSGSGALRLRLLLPRLRLGPNARSLRPIRPRKPAK